MCTEKKNLGEKGWLRVNSLIYSGLMKSNLPEKQTSWIQNNYKCSGSIRQYFLLTYNLRNANEN